MKTKEQNRKNWSDRAARLRLADLCIRCMGNRTAKPGHTADRCATCSEKNRVKSRERMRKKRGTPIDLPLVPRARGPRSSASSTATRSDEYVPDKYKSQGIAGDNVTTREERNEYNRHRRVRLINEGKCKDCALPRDGEGCTRTYCADCAAKRRANQRARNGTPLDAPVQKQLHPRQTDVVLGTLTRADVRRATTTLPLKPPGK